jgi:hypothetical protein
MRRRAVALLTVMLMLGLTPGPALAAGTVDQSNVAVGGGSWGGKTFAQTVTVGRTGNLTGVDLILFETLESKTTVSIEDLYRGDGRPTGPARASATVTVSSQGWYHVEFPTPVYFLAGGHFAIVFSATVKGVALASTGTYPGGQAFSYGSAWTPLNGDPNLDFAFRTYVEKAAAPTAQPIPLPTAVPTAAPTAAPTAVPTAAPTAAPKITLAPTPKPVPATANPVATASPIASGPIAAAATTDLTASPATTDTPAPAASASAGTSSQPNPLPGSSGDSGGPPIVLIIVGIVALAAVLGGGIGLGFVLARRPRGVPPAP